jgi:hypothetical protein
MSGGVKTYVYQELSKKAASEPGVRPFQEQKFEAHVNAKAVDNIHKKSDAFKLDSMVMDQLGIEARENQAQEERIKKEIERRWEQAAEKAEVAGFTRGLEEGKTEAYKAELPRIRERLEKFVFFFYVFYKINEKIFKSQETFYIVI